MSSPLLVFGAGQRCGSTLLQRLICSHPEAFIWGEQGGHLGHILDAVEGLAGHSARSGRGAREEFAKLGYQGFLANLMAEPSVMRGAFEDFCTRLFRTPGARVWGFKEVRYDLGFATRLQSFLPQLRVIFVTRDPRDVLRSLDEWERFGWWSRESSVEAIDHWQGISASFLETGSVPVLSMRYEDYIADPEGTAGRVGEFAGLDPAGFDLSVFDRRVHNLGAEGKRKLRAWGDLPIDLRALLFEETIRATAQAYDYSLY